MVNWAGAVARVLNGEDGLASHFSRPIDRCSGGATTGAKLSLLHHHTITLISISPATITPPCDVHAQGYELVASARPPLLLLLKKKERSVRLSLLEEENYVLFYDFPPSMRGFQMGRGEIMPAWTASPLLELGSLTRHRGAGGLVWQ